MSNRMTTTEVMTFLFTVAALFLLIGAAMLPSLLSSLDSAPASTPMECPDNRLFHCIVQLTD